MEFTPDILRAAYAFLAETEPFSGWNMPDAEEVEFVVTNSRVRCGRCHTYELLEGPLKRSYRFKVEISDTLHAYPVRMLETMAHEMVHIHLREAEGYKGKDSHGKEFRAVAATVCVAHGFDPGAF